MANAGAPSTTGSSETARGAVERTEPTKAQRSAIRRVAESKATAPHLYLEAEVRTSSNQLAGLVAAIAQALREVPRLNGAYRDGAFETYSRVNVGVAMVGEGGPVVPTIFDADEKGQDEIGAELAALASKAAEGNLTSGELSGGTFTVVALASGSVDSLTPILNQGQAAALAIGPVTERALARDGAVVAGAARTATLACDARIVGAEEGARFLDRVRDLLESGAEGR